MTTSTPRSNRHEDNIQVGTDWSNFHHKREKKKEDWSSPKRDQNCCDEGRESRTDSHHERKDSATYVVNQHDDRGDNKSDHKQRQPSGFGRAKNVDKKVGANVAAVVRRGGANPYPQPQPNKLPSQVILEMLKKSGIDMPVEQFQRAAAESVKKTGEKDEESAKEKSVAKQKKVEVTRQQNNQAKDTSAQPETYKCAESLPFDSQPVRPSDSPTDVQAAVAQVINNNSLFFDPYQQYRVDCNNPTNASVLPASNVSFDIDSILRAIPSSYDDFEFFNEKLSAVKGPQYEPESQLLQIGSTQLNIESPQKGYDGLKWKSPFDSHLSVLKNDQTSDTKVTGSSPFGFSTDDISHKVGLSSHLDSFGILTPQPPAAESPGLSLLDPNDLEVQLINESRLKVENILGNSDMMKLFYSQPNPELPAATTLVNELQSQAAKLTTNLSATIEIIKPQKTVSTSAKHPKKKEESKLPSQWKISESWSLAKPKKLTEESENKTSDSHSVVSETHSDSRQSPQPSLPSFGAVPLAEVNVVADWLAQQDLAQKAPEPHTIQTLLKLPPTTISPEMIGGNDWRSGLAAYTAARFGGGETKSVAAGAETIMSDGSVSGRSSAHSAPGKDDLIVKAAQKITWAKWGAGGLGT